MAENVPKRLTIKEAKAKVAECGEMGARAKLPEHRFMLEHMRYHPGDKPATPGSFQFQ